MHMISLTDIINPLVSFRFPVGFLLFSLLNNQQYGKLAYMKKITISIEDNLHKELKIICANNDVSIKDVITRFITEFINLNSKGPQ